MKCLSDSDFKAEVLMKKTPSLRRVSFELMSLIVIIGWWDYY